MDAAILTILIRGAIAAALVAGGILSLILGSRLYLKDVGEHPSEADLNIGKFKAGAKGVGAVTMLTACVWGYVAYLAAPSYKGAGEEVVTIPINPQTDLLQARIVDLKDKLSSSRLAAEYLALGLNKFYEDDYDAAVALYDKAIAIDPGNPLFLDRKGQALYLGRRKEEAIRIYKKLATEYPEYFSTQVNLNLLRRESFEKKLAEEFVEEDIDAITRPAYPETTIVAMDQPGEPQNARKYRLEGDRFAELKDVENAIARYEEALRVDGDNLLAAHNLGVMFDQLGRTEEAIAAYERAISIKPDKRTYLNLGILHARERQFETAEDMFNSALELDPAFAVVYWNLGIVLKEQGRLEESDIAFSQARELGYVPEHRHEPGTLKN